MRTTLIIDDQLLIRTKRRAVERHATVSDIVNDALRTYLVGEVSAAAPFRLVTYGRPSKAAHEPADFAEALEVEDRDRLHPSC